MKHESTHKTARELRDGIRKILSTGQVLAEDGLAMFPHADRMKCNHALRAIGAKSSAVPGCKLYIWHYRNEKLDLIRFQMAIDKYKRLHHGGIKNKIEYYDYMADMASRVVDKNMKIGQITKAEFDAKIRAAREKPIPKATWFEDEYLDWSNG